MRLIFGIFMALALNIVFSVTGEAQEAAKSPVVVELFTSQGCSACPPADQFLKELAQQPDIVALTFNVEYWDYLGWKDTLARADHSKRQKDYASHRGDREVFTPQMVINGQYHVVGSRRSDVMAAISRAKDARQEATIDIVREGIKLQVLVEAGAQEAEETVQPATVWLMLVQPEVKVLIEGGENTDKAIQYTNVVRKMIPIGIWQGKALQIELPVEELQNETMPMAVAMLQEGEGGPIIASTSLIALQPAR